MPNLKVGLLRGAAIGLGASLVLGFVFPAPARPGEPGAEEGPGIGGPPFGGPPFGDPAPDPAPGAGEEEVRKIPADVKAACAKELDRLGKAGRGSSEYIRSLYHLAGFGKAALLLLAQRIDDGKAGEAAPPELFLLKRIAQRAETLLKEVESLEGEPILSHIHDLGDPATRDAARAELVKSGAKARIFLETHLFKPDGKTPEDEIFKTLSEICFKELGRVLKEEHLEKFYPSHPNERPFLSEAEATPKNPEEPAAPFPFQAFPEEFSGGEDPPPLRWEYSPWRYAWFLGCFCREKVLAETASTKDIPVKTHLTRLLSLYFDPGLGEAFEKLAREAEGADARYRFLCAFTLGRMRRFEASKSLYDSVLAEADAERAKNPFRELDQEGPLYLEMLDSADEGERRLGALVLEKETGKDFEYDPAAGAEERKKAREQWEKFWEEGRPLRTYRIPEELRAQIRHYREALLDFERRVKGAE